MKHLIIAGALAVLVVGGLAPAATVEAAPYCGITWGSTAKNTKDRGAGEVVTNVRTGRHTCFDRIVVDVSDSTTGYAVRYVDKVRADGSGEVIPLAGGAKLRIIVDSPSYDDNGNATYPAKTGGKLPGVNLEGYKTFRDAKFAGSFEGRSTFGLGVRARLPFRAFITGNHVVIDVAHKW